MKLGAENRTKVIILGVLLVAAVISVARMFSVFGGSPAPTAAPGSNEMIDSTGSA